MSGVLTGVSTAAGKPGLGLGRSRFSGHWHGGQESGGARPSEPAALTCLVETLVAASWTGCDAPLPGSMVATASVPLGSGAGASTAGGLAAASAAGLSGRLVLRRSVLSSAGSSRA